MGDDIAARPIAEIGRQLSRPLGTVGWNIHSRPRGLAAGDAQRFEKTFGDGVGLAAGKPPHPRGTVETLDRHHIGNTEARKGITHITFADEAAQVGYCADNALTGSPLSPRGSLMS